MGRKTTTQQLLDTRLSGKICEACEASRNENRTVSGQYWKKPKNKQNKNKNKNELHFQLRIQPFSYP